jgi:hypothetical protein
MHVEASLRDQAARHRSPSPGDASNQHLDLRVGATRFVASSLCLVGVVKREPKPIHEVAVPSEERVFDSNGPHHTTLASHESWQPQIVINRRALQTPGQRSQSEPGHIVQCHWSSPRWLVGLQILIETCTEPTSRPLRERLRRTAMPNLACPRHRHHPPSSPPSHRLHVAFPCCEFAGSSFVFRIPCKCT